MDNTELRPVPLPPYDTSYFVDSDGFVWSKLKGRPRHKGERRITCYRQVEGEWFKLIKPIPQGKQKNYLAVSMSNPRKTTTVHRLVSLAFNYNPNHSCLQVNHKNRNTFDNTPDNLEWVTNQENCQHRFNTSLPRPYPELRNEWELMFKARQEQSDFYQVQERGSWNRKYDEKKIAHLLRTTDWSASQIAVHLECTHRAVRHWQEKFKIPRPKVRLISKVQAVLATNPEWTPNQVASEIGVRVTSVHAVLRKVKCNDQRKSE